MSKREKQASIANAQEWTRGKKLSIEHLRNHAKGREQRASGASHAEIALSQMLLRHGVKCIPQLAIDKYNVDLATDRLAIEVLGGLWHSSKPNHIKRLRYILNQGWNVVYIWAIKNRSPLSEIAADYIVAFLNELRGDPSLRGQYRVLRGDGQELARGCAQDDNIAIVVKGYEGGGG
jgi:very-short-patch-repair endonuclease